MKFLLDTHVLLWYLDGDPSPKRVVETLQNSNDKRIVSIVSLWELSIKMGLNKLQTSKTLTEIHQHLLTEINFEILDVKFSHLNELLTLPHYHNDPFDRLLISHAISENLTIISADRHFNSYPVNVIW